MTKEIIFEASDWGYEEGWKITIFQHDDILWCHNIGAYEMQPPCDETYEISQEDALYLMVEMEEFED